MAPDHRLLGAMFGYIERFPERLHHPKEDDYLFARLRVRRPEAAPLLDGLHREHEIGRERFADLKALYERYVADASTLPAFTEAVERYSHFHWKHMRREEEEVLPLAAQALTGEDWAAIDAAFASNSDPIVGVPAAQGVPRAVPPARGDVAGLTRTAGRVEAAEQRRQRADERASRRHAITRSALSSMSCGKRTPSAVAVRWLRTRSTLVGSSIGRSPGRAPFRMRSTWYAARRNIAAMSGA